MNATLVTNVGHSPFCLASLPPPPQRCPPQNLSRSKDVGAD
jgi:hypothetical protein